MRFLDMQGKTWAVGLQWHQGGRRKFPELVAEAERLDPELNFVALRRLQHGYAKCHPEDVEMAGGTHALAASLRVSSQSLLGAFCLRSRRGREFWWVFAIRDSLISGQGDNVFSTREEADKHVNSVRDLLGDFETNVLCESHEESLVWISSLLAPRTPASFYSAPRLRPLHASASGRGKLFLAAGCLAVAALGWFLLDSYLVNQRIFDAQERLRITLRDKEAHKRRLLEHPERHFVRGWLKAPPAEETARRCLQSMRKLPSFSSGWKMEGADCDGAHVAVTWNHNVGGDYLSVPDGARLESASKSLSRYPLESAASVRGDEELLTRDLAGRRLYQLTQAVGARLSLNFSAPEQKEAEGVKLSAPWLGGTWEISQVPAACILDESFGREFGLPGVTLESVSLKNNNWTFKGNIHVRQ